MPITVPILYLLFLLSGVSGLVYQVAWVRAFGNILGNTVYSASLVVGIFMLGLGVGSLLVGRWADTQYTRPRSLLRMYGYFEVAIGVMGGILSVLLPALGSVSEFASSYWQLANGWYVLSPVSYLGRAAIATALLTPITLLMGGTLTLLVRHLVRHDLDVGGRRIALLYGVNTVGAAMGALLTDYTLVPAVGLRVTQLVAVTLNIMVGLGALVLARGGQPSAVAVVARPPKRKRSLSHDADPDRVEDSGGLAWVGVALALSGCAAMGMEILWFRHFSLLLGGFRAVFSLLLAIVLAGIAAGSFAVAGALRSSRVRPAELLMLVEGLFVVFALAGVARADVGSMPVATAALAQALGAGWTGAWNELRLIGTPIVLEVGLPALLMGCAFPLGNAVIQHAEAVVAGRAGALYLANTIGAVCGSLATGFLLLPAIGIQQTGTVLAAVALLSIPALYGATRKTATAVPAFALSMAAALMAIGMWLGLPRAAIITRADLPMSPAWQVVARSEGVNEVVTVLDAGAEGRQLLTNGHPMSSTSFIGERYMRALAHVPLLAMDRTSDVLVIGFGVGNTTDALSLHPSVRRIEVVDVSRQVLEHAAYFHDANHDVLHNPRVVVYINDGRDHLRMRPPASYDLVTLEPPPPIFSGVGALYSKDFYELVRTRLKPGGYVSQWLPAYQITEPTALAMIRAFIDVFPQTVLLSGADQELLLVGANGAAIEIDPNAVAAALARVPGVQADLQRFSLGTPREIVGTFLASPLALAAATRDAAPVTDDHPLQEYDARSLLTAIRRTVPPSLYALSGVAAWCPNCFAAGKPVAAVEGLDTYLALLEWAYAEHAPPDAGPGSLADPRTLSLLQSSAYLRALLPNVRTLIGFALAGQRRFDEAVVEFRAEVALRPEWATARWNLGKALLVLGQFDEGIDELGRAADLDPANEQIQEDLLRARDARQQLRARGR